MPTKTIYNVSYVLCLSSSLDEPIMSCPPSRFYIDEPMDSDSSSKGSKKRTAITDVFPMIKISSEQDENGGSIPEKTPARRGSVVNSSDVARMSENLSLGVTNDKMRRCNSYNDLQSATLDNSSAKPSGGSIEQWFRLKTFNGIKNKVRNLFERLELGK